MAGRPKERRLKATLVEMAKRDIGPDATTFLTFRWQKNQQSLGIPSRFHSTVLTWVWLALCRGGVYAMRAGSGVPHVLLIRHS
jgi:hypothetical protein